ncbi:ATP synthase F1 subunit epsilon [Fulvivirga lutea]|uniref:ATP synthase F1 subunit epsilon n=1 Tax=Fulvivirga lutea TaxID=2810512 RepID=A0A974WFZ5_9BACT|nr:ATP synthase F1 subunit epsilon [Fulvivirga lutea]QSE97561.1 ATP synthase F1 subunit epsilon [Fulvivirga lutea]
MFLEVVTPTKKVFAGEVSIVTFPGVDGSFQVMNDHAPIVSTLKKGELVYKVAKGGEDGVEITGGVVEVLNNRIVVLADGLVEA